MVPRILDLELSRADLIRRLLVASFLGGFTLLLLFVIPSNVSTIISWLSSSLPATIPVKELTSLAQEFIPEILPVLGFVIAGLIFLGRIFKKTMLEGPIVLAQGLADLVYLYVVFQGGTMRFTIPANIIPNTTATISIILTTIMILFIVTPILVIVKGILITLEHKKAQREVRTPLVERTLEHPTNQESSIPFN